MENNTGLSSGPANRVGGKPQSASIGFGEVKAVSLPGAGNAADAPAPIAPLAVPKPEDMPRSTLNPAPVVNLAPKPEISPEALRPAAVKLSPVPLAGLASTPAPVISPTVVENATP